jgi:adenylate kinase family enzyme
MIVAPGTAIAPAWLWRIAIVGLPGAGKTTLARQLAQPLSRPYIELTRLRWQSGWVKVANSHLQARIAYALQGETWIVEGTYRQIYYVNPEWITLMLWLDYPRYVILRRLIRRTLWRWLTHTEFSPGNYEHLGRLIGRDSVVAAVWRNHRHARHTFTQQASSGMYTTIPVVRLRRPIEATRLLHRLFRAREGSHHWM